MTNPELVIKGVIEKFEEIYINNSATDSQLKQVISDIKELASFAQAYAAINPGALPAEWIIEFMYSFGSKQYSFIYEYGMQFLVAWCNQNLKNTNSYLSHLEEWLDSDDVGALRCVYNFACYLRYILSVFNCGYLTSKEIIYRTNSKLAAINFKYDDNNSNVRTPTTCANIIFNCDFELPDGKRRESLSFYVLTPQIFDELNSDKGDPFSENYTGNWYGIEIDTDPAKSAAVSSWSGINKGSWTHIVKDVIAKSIVKPIV